MTSASIPLVVAAAILISSSICSGQCIPRESKALLMFKTSLIDHSDMLASWTNEVDCCSWYGVICDNFGGHVRELHLQATINSMYLQGRIPKDINALQKLESLDLSQNCLSGEIPQSMSSMTFLSNLNLSNNNLSGQIPASTQLQSMDPSSFGGNELCGPPLTKDCNKKEETPPSNSERREDHGNETGAVDWFYFYVSLAPGFVVGFWCVVGPLAFNIRWRRAYYNFLDPLWDKIWVWFHVNIVRFVWNYGS